MQKSSDAKLLFAAFRMPNRITDKKNSNYPGIAVPEVFQRTTVIVIPQTQQIYWYIYN